MRAVDPGDRGVVFEPALSYAIGPDERCVETDPHKATIAHIGPEGFQLPCQAAPSRLAAAALVDHGNAARPI